MKIKALTMTALLGVFLAGSNAHAWSNYWHGYNKHPVVVHHKVKVYHKPYHKHHRKVVKYVHAKPSTWHTHPKNGLTNDTYHQHPNGNNHHAHHYGTGGHKHGGQTYSVCPYPH